MMKKKLVALLMAGTMAMTLPIGGSVKAANTTDTPIDFSISALNFNQTTDAREKTNTTPVYLYLTYMEDNSTVQVRALGVAGTKSENLTNKGLTGKHIDAVTCRVNVQYSIHNYIKESAYGKAKLAFKSNNAIFAEKIKGVWSPDSTKSYTHAS